MSRRPKRSAVEAVATCLMAAGIFVTPFLTASTTAFLVVVCAACFAVFAYLLLTRRWWPAVVTALVSAQPVVNLISHDHTSHFERRLVLGLGLAGVAILFVREGGQRARARESQRDRKRPAGE